MSSQVSDGLVTTLQPLSVSDCFLSHLKGQSIFEAQNSTVEVFGKWQTEEYVPPPVVNVSVVN